MPGAAAKLAACRHGRGARARVPPHGEGAARRVVRRIRIGTAPARPALPVQRSRGLDNRQLGLQRGADRLRLRAHPLARSDRRRGPGPLRSGAAAQRLRRRDCRAHRTGAPDVQRRPGVRAVAGGTGDRRGHRRACRARVRARGADRRDQRRVYPRCLGDDPVGRRRGRPGRRQCAQRDDRQPVRDRRPGGRRRAAADRLTGAGLRRERRQLRDLGGARLPDAHPQPSGRRDGGGDRGSARPDGRRRTRDRRPAGGSHAGRLLRARQLRLRHRHRAVRRRLRTPAAHRRPGLRLHARRTGRRRPPDGGRGEPARRLAPARADHHRRPRRLLPSHRTADGDAQRCACLPGRDRAGSLDPGRRRARR